MQFTTSTRTVLLNSLKLPKMHVHTVYISTDYASLNMIKLIANSDDFYVHLA